MSNINDIVKQKEEIALKIICDSLSNPLETCDWVKSYSRGVFSTTTIFVNEQLQCNLIDKFNISPSRGVVINTEYQLVVLGETNELNYYLPITEDVKLAIEKFKANLENVRIANKMVTLDKMISGVLNK